MKWNFFIPMILYFTAISNNAHASTVDFQEDIQPIFDKFCVACHACFDAPCQLILTNSKGLSRGANKTRVYDALRATPSSPTRLFIDAESDEQWRDKGFFSVISGGSSNTSATRTSVLGHLLEKKELPPLEPNSRLQGDIDVGLKRSNVCPTRDEINDANESYNHGDLPFQLMGVKDSEYRKILKWLEQGAKLPSLTVDLSVSEHKTIRIWEAFFNRKGSRQQIVARWLYEHLFMGHLYFGDIKSEQFFQLVRSTTPPGTAIKQIATRRPNDDPGGKFFYRLQRVQGTIPFKNHVVLSLDNNLLDRINTLFFTGDWESESLPGYTDKERANPFQTFSAIPANARYRFMLEHAEYFIQTYIRGSVCQGQIATDVIRDHFWVIFQSPESDLYVTSAAHRKRATPFMEIAGVEQDLLDGASTWFSVSKQYIQYNEIRQSDYEHTSQAKVNLNHIWANNKGNANSLLTVFRHHDNVSVRNGLLGDYPQTAWWLDFPLLERGYYNLVVNFDVFGSIAHQAQTRLYFDLIRNDAERNFLRLMPTSSRQEMMDEWYEGLAQIKLMTTYQEVSDKKAPGIRYRSDDPKREFFDLLLKNFDHVNEWADNINRGENSGASKGQLSDFTRRHAKLFRRIASIKAENFPAVEAFPEVVFLRVFDGTRQREVYSVLRNRKHSNVAFLFGESLRRKPEQDTLGVYPGILASYVNFIFNVSNDELDDFIDALLLVKNESEFEKNIVRRWGVRQTHPDFWELFHDMTVYLSEHNSKEAGVMDLSRYENL